MRPRAPSALRTAALQQASLHTLLYQMCHIIGLSDSVSVSVDSLSSAGVYHPPTGTIHSLPKWGRSQTNRLRSMLPLNWNLATMSARANSCYFNDKQTNSVLLNYVNIKQCHFTYQRAPSSGAPWRPRRLNLFSLHFSLTNRSNVLKITGE